MASEQSKVKPMQSIDSAVQITCDTRLKTVVPLCCSNNSLDLNRITSLFDLMKRNYMISKKSNYESFIKIGMEEDQNEIT